MAENILNVEVYDIEVFRKMMLYCGENVVTGIRYQYEISRRKNEIDGLMKHLTDRSFEYGCGYNNVNYDNQVLQFILDNHNKWYDYSIEQVLSAIYEFSQESISLTNHELQPIYREKYMEIKQIDLFRIHHYDNKNRRVGLKTLEFAMDLEDIEEMPMDFRKEYLTDQELDDVIIYCWNDVIATKRFYDITRGNTDNELYKGKDKIQDRLDIIEEVGFDNTCINWSNSKIGDEINKKGYMSETGCTISKLYEKKKKRAPTKPFTFGSCIPDYITFKSRAFRQLIKDVNNVRVNLGKTKDPQEFIVKYGNTTYSIMRGGIHSHDTERVLIPAPGYILRDADIGSQYPNTLRKRELYPLHLGPRWLVMYEKNIYRRIDYKAKGKENRKYKGLADTWKDCLNAGGYGQTNQPDNWQYDPSVMFRCTIGNQFEILMLIEWLEDAGISVVSANTDGIVSMIPPGKEEEYQQICDKWEVIVGSDKLGKLEYADYSKLIQTSVNDYIGIYTNGKVKLKGDFCIDVEMHKNKSKRIVPIALHDYWVKGIPVEETVRTNRNIYNYVIGKKASKDYWYQGIDRKTGHVNNYNKMLRYYCSIDGERLYKCKHENSEKKGPPRSKCESGSLYQTMFNRSFHLDNWKDYKIDESYYLQEIYKIQDKLLPEAARDRKQAAKHQMSLFG